jgi:integrase
MRSLGFRVRDADGRLISEAVVEAKRQASNLSNLLIRKERPTRIVTVADLFRLFQRDEVAALHGKHGDETERALEAWKRFLGSRTPVERVGVREWKAYSRDRASGEMDARGGRVSNPEKRRPVGPRTVAKDLKVLRQACIFGTRYRTRDGGFLLRVDPTRGLPLPSEKNPARPVADDATLTALMEKAANVTMRHGSDEVRTPLRELLILAAYTGRRIGSILALRWSDWRPDEGTHGAMRWRADADKLGREWWTPVHPAVRGTLEAWRAASPGLGETWVFPAPESHGPIRVDVARRWLLHAEKKARIPHRQGFGFHAFRRMWATKRKHLSPTDVAHVGGWKDTATLQRVYQQPDPDTMEDVVLGDRELRFGGGGR